MLKETNVFFSQVNERLNAKIRERGLWLISLWFVVRRA
jgi:hypothetical protein